MEEEKGREGDRAEGGMTSGIRRKGGIPVQGKRKEGRETSQECRGDRTVKKEKGREMDVVRG